MFTSGWRGDSNWFSEIVTDDGRVFRGIEQPGGLTNWYEMEQVADIEAYMRELPSEWIEVDAEYILTMCGEAIGVLSPVEAAELRNVSVKAVYDVLRDTARRAEIFPGAQKFGNGKRGVWEIPAPEVAAWEPRTYPRNK